MLVKASVARSPNQLAQHVRQKVLVAAVARGVPTINDLLKRADEDKSGALSYKEFYTTLRKLLQLTAAAVTDDAVRQTFKVIDKTGDGALSREEFATFLRGKNTSDDAQLVDCLDAKNKLAARQAALRREARLKLLRKRLRKAVQLHGAFFENHDTEWSLDEFLEVVRTTLALGAHAITDADVDMVFRELSESDKLHPDAVARFVNPPEKAREKENAAPPPAPSDAPSRLDALSRPKRVHDKPPPSEDATPWKATSITSPIPPLPPSPRTPGGTRRRQPALSPGGRADQCANQIVATRLWTPASTPSTRRVQERRSRLVFSSILRPFGPRRGRGPTATGEVPRTAPARAPRRRGAIGGLPASH